MDYNIHFNFKRCFQKMLLGAIALITAPVTPVPCKNIFPKVFGADQAFNTALENTKLYQIDIFSDYLALGGNIESPLLTDISSDIPYVAVLSMANTG